MLSMIYILNLEESCLHWPFLVLCEYCDKKLSGFCGEKSAVGQRHRPLNPIPLFCRSQQLKFVFQLLFPLQTVQKKTMTVATKATIASFGGKLLKCAHTASTTNCEMAFNLYLPPQTTANSPPKVPLLIYLAGLTCTGDNGAEKGFFQHAASQKGIAILYPDTSPRASKSILFFGEKHPKNYYHHNKHTHTH